MTEYTLEDLSRDAAEAESKVSSANNWTSKTGTRMVLQNPIYSARDDGDFGVDIVAVLTETLIRRINEARAEADGLRSLVQNIDKTLRVWAFEKSEYVPAIGDVFALIDEAGGKQT